MTLAEVIVEHTLTEEGSLTRGEIVKLTGMKRTTVYDALTRLYLKGKVQRKAIAKGIGRPPVYWDITDSISPVAVALQSEVLKLEQI